MGEWEGRGEEGKIVMGGEKRGREMKGQEGRGKRGW